MKSILLLIVVSCLISCVSDTPKNKISEPDAEPKKELTSEIAVKLYANYHQNPSNQLQIDENALLDYAIDHNLDVTRTASGLYYIIHKEGNGPTFVMGQPFKAHYRGYTLDGKIFDSSYKKNRPIIYNVGDMVTGWNEAFQIMNVGTKAQLLIPSRLAYGAGGYPGLIKPNTPIAFDLEILPLP